MRHKRYLVFLVIFAASLAAGSSCGKKEAVKPSPEAMKASKALGVLQGMEQAYKARDMAGVTGPVSPDFKGGAAEFTTSVRKDMDAYVRVSLDLAVERVEESGQDVRVVCHWYGRWWDREGKSVEGRGNAVFVFRDVGEMRLVGITGDPPFGVVR